jgi:hypothetical protein
MAGFDDPSFYGDRWADVYDDHFGELGLGPAVEFLAGLAGDGRVLELAIGTGRVALPLAHVPVSGRFRLVYLIFNTLFGLLSQARQAECFASVARVTARECTCGR